MLCLCGLEFGQEATATAALAAMVAGKTDPSSTTSIGSSSAASKSFETSAAGAPGGAKATAESESAGGGAAGDSSSSSRARKLNQTELEELARQEELDALRAQVQQYSTTGII